MVIDWSDTAKKRLKEVYYYYKKEVNERKALEIVKEIIISVSPLSEFPEMASIEPLLTNRKKIYRSLVITKTYKVIYYIENEIIHIAEIWDCRQNPKKLKKGIKK